MQLQVHHDDVGKRLAYVMSNAGASITFTSVTDVLAFGIGYTIGEKVLSDDNKTPPADIPLVKYFCLLNTVAIAFDFLYQVTFFPAAMLQCEKLRPFQKKVRLDILDKCDNAFLQYYKKSIEKISSLFHLKHPEKFLKNKMSTISVQVALRFL